MIKNIHIMADDWEGLYIHGKLFDQGHSIPDIKMFRAGMVFSDLGYDITELKRVHVEDIFDDCELEEDLMCNLPELAEDLPALVKEYAKTV